MVCNWECAIHSWQLSSVSNNLSFHYTVFSWGFWSWIMILPDMHSSIVPNNHLVEFLIIYLSWWLILLKTISYELVAEIPLILRVYWMLNHWNPKCWRVQSSFFHYYVHQIPARKKTQKKHLKQRGFHGTIQGGEIRKSSAGCIIVPSYADIYHLHLESYQSISV